METFFTQVIVIDAYEDFLKCSTHVREDSFLSTLFNTKENEREEMKLEKGKEAGYEYHAKLLRSPRASASAEHRC